MLAGCDPFDTLPTLLSVLLDTFMSTLATSRGTASMAQSTASFRISCTSSGRMTLRIIGVCIRHFTKPRRAGPREGSRRDTRSPTTVKRSGSPSAILRRCSLSAGGSNSVQSFLKLAKSPSVVRSASATCSAPGVLLDSAGAPLEAPGVHAPWSSVFFGFSLAVAVAGSKAGSNAGKPSSAGPAGLKSSAGAGRPACAAGGGGPPDLSAVACSGVCHIGGCPTSGVASPVFTGPWPAMSGVAAPARRGVSSSCFAWVTMGVAAPRA
mmetsp:Transcript_21043/g.59788  ORF Transcript_21043/g.59788 Transcript_21043/m.59788 type:complete len:266 (+) Transcript_21043:429-1226(+)